MAQLKDTIILGDLSTTGNLYTGNAYANSISLNGLANGANNTGYGLNISNAHIGVNTDNNLLAIHSTADIQMRPGGWNSNGYIFTTDQLRPPTTRTQSLGSTSYRWKNIYCGDTLLIGQEGFTGPTSGASGIYASQAGFIEMDGSTPFIDFHNANSTADFTGRIIADNANGLNISPRLGINTGANASYNLYCNGPSYFNGAAYINNKLTINAGTNAPPLQINSSAGSWSYIRLHNGSNFWDIATLNAANGVAAANSLGFRYAGAAPSASAGVYITPSQVLFGAAWNDYAEYRELKEDQEIPYGHIVIENGDDTLSLSTERLQPGGQVVSDTFGFAIGQTEKCKLPIAVSGRALVYTYEDRYEFNAGDAVCTGPNGTVSKMTREEIREYPERIIGTVSAIPEYENWGEGNVKVDDRIWIYIK